MYQKPLNHGGIFPFSENALDILYIVWYIFKPVIYRYFLWPRSFEYIEPGERFAVEFMQCLFCKVDNDKVINSRTSVDGLSIKRRRECLGCGRRYTTYERIEESPLRVVKKDGTRESFDRRKILKGLERACEKRPVSTDTLENIVNEIEREIYNKFDREVTTNFIGALVMQKLKILDAVAYVRFASVYREFKDISEFIDELKPLMTNVPKKKKDGSNDSRSISLQH